MRTSVERPVAGYRFARGAFWVSLLVALLLQIFLPLHLTFARLFDFPLLVVIYFALARRNKPFGTLLGMTVGLMQDALSHGHIGIFGMAKSAVGYAAASAGIKVDVDEPLSRFALTAILVLAHRIFLLLLERALLESSPQFVLLDFATNLLVNVAIALIMFQLLDHFRQAA